MPRDHLVPAEHRTYGWIEDVFSQGIRRLAYPADRWAERWIAAQFRALGLERVRAEPIELPYLQRLHALHNEAAADGQQPPWLPLPKRGEGWLAEVVGQAALEPLRGGEAGERAAELPAWASKPRSMRV
jgi:hypothetical protein